MAGVVQAGAGADADDDGPVAGVAQWIDELTEKGKATRGAALDELTAALRKSPVTGRAQLEGRLETLVQNLRGVLKKAGSEEFAKACALAQVLGLCVGEGDAKTVFEELLPALKPFCNGEAPRDGLSEHALTALASLCFFCNEEASHLAAVMAACESFINGFVADEPKVAALRGWGLLSTVLDDTDLVARRDGMIKMLQPLLGHDSLDVQIEAGENLAFVVASTSPDGTGASSETTAAVEVAAEQGLVVENSSAFVTTAGDAAAAPSGEQPVSVSVSAGASGDEDEWLDDLIQKLEDLSHDGNKARSKRDLKEQRARFRAIVSSVRDGEAPSERIVVDKTPVPLDTWSDIKRLDFAKEALREGFAEHFKCNPLLHDVFDIRGRGLEEHLFGDRLVAMDGRSYFTSGVSKAGTLERNKARKKREAIKGDFMTDDH